jgi:hypothetical protein
MARASSIWVVEDVFGPIAAFTVKRELLAWLSQSDWDRVNCTVTRLVDNSPNYVPIDVSGILNER